jgi:hypothetical protein
MKQLHKKGVWSDIKDAVLAIAILCVCLYLVWAYILHGIVPTSDKLQQCSALTGNGGVCKAACDPTSEFGVSGLGCKGKASLCCISNTQNMATALLPLQYGGDSNYDFVVEGITFGDISSTTRCSIKPDDFFRKTIICEPGYTYVIPVEISVKNLYKSSDVYANPAIIINGNGDKILVGKYPGTEKIKLEVASAPSEAIPEEDNPDVITTIPGDAPTQIIPTSIKISSSQSLANDYWEIYPYVQCDTKECQKTDSPAGRGILNSNNDEFLTISFESKTS